VRALRLAWRRLAGQVSGARRDDELNVELESHIEMLTEEYVGRGMAPDEARRAAALVFGGVEVAKERYRDQRGLPGLRSVSQDVRYALRGMRRNPGFTAVALVCLALGIGANTAVFGLLNAVMLRALPVTEPQRVVFFRHSGGQGDLSAVRRLSSGNGRSALPYAAYEAMRDNARTLSGVFVYAAAGQDGNGLTVFLGDRALVSAGEMVTGSYFSVLGVSPALGRALVDDDLEPGSPNVTVVSDAFWRRELGRTPSAVGTSIRVNGVPFTIVGVAPPGFAGLHSAPADLWLPLRPTDDLRPWGSRAASSQTFFTDRTWWWCTVGGRLAPGATQAEARVETDYLFRRVITSGLRDAPSDLPGLELASASPVFEAIRKKLGGTLRALTVTAVLVLLIACANLASLQMARGRARRREIEIRLALGASRARVSRQLLTESLLLAFLGGTVGLVVARWGGHLLLRLVVGGAQTTPLNVEPDGTVLAFAIGLSAAAGILSGLTPALRATRVGPGFHARKAVPAGRRDRTARLAIASQIALSAVLLHATGLFIRTAWNLDGQPLGFDREALLLFDVDPERSGYKNADGMTLHRRLLEAVLTVPGVGSATFSQVALLSGAHNSTPTGTDGVPLPLDQPDEVYFNRVGPRFVETMGMQLVVGHDIGWRDADGYRPTAVVNESWARAYFPGESPIGHRVSLGGNAFRPDRSYEIVGVTRDAKYNDMRDQPPRTVYVSYFAKWDRSRQLCYAVRAAGDPVALAASVRDAVRRVDPALPMFNVKSQRAQIDEALASERMLARISGCLGLLAVVLVAVGIYGTLSYSVARRTGEIGIRVALGARRASVLWNVLSESLVVAGFGLAAGLPVALASGRIVSSSLYGVGPRDGVTLAATAALLLAIAALSGLAPAGRATRIDPIEALRHE
jgi:predicted permease